MLTDRRILITGGTGYLGSWMAELAQREGARVRLLVRSLPPHWREWANKFDIVRADITDRTTLAGVCKDQEVIWHTASVNETVTEQDPEAALRVNVFGTYNILAEAADCGVDRVIKFSTFHVYGPAAPSPVTEDSPTAPTTAYGLTNLLSEECVRYFRRIQRVKGINIRISNGYGAPLFKETNRWTLVVNDLVRMAVERRELVLRSSGIQTRDFVAITDVFRAVRQLSFAESNFDSFNIGGRTVKSILDIATLVQNRYAERYHETIPILAPTASEGSVPRAVEFDISRMVQLGYHPENRLAAEIDRTFDLLEQ